ncbi:ABC transporter ATP-binding protein [Rhodococcus sp. P1Y]|uniref:ABC transporter ATP-binding protein n=1 Tax=Rhodococcus sp. P1Y TaxID=1302308 RepID=UPI000EB210C9|nr:ABC transporter ATP-binding protein [Rhodococcus sp. P1Y]AYJ52146.1 ABC transporter ATP-binding protein [Rhodococcus sp. P1Y]
MTRVRVSGLTKSYDGRRVLDGVSFEVQPGEFVSLIGPSGSGKSTIFNMLAGLDTPDSGVVGAPRSAYMPQKDLLFPWRTVLDNTSLGLEIQGVPRKEARAQAQALFPVFGLDGYEKSRPSDMSGGMRQRAALLRTVVQGHDLLLLDEPFGALDSLTRTAMQRWLQEMWLEYGWTVLMITHDIREAVYLSDRVIVLSDKPARVRRQITVPLARPRDPMVVTTPAFAAVEAELMDVLIER